MEDDVEEDDNAGQVWYYWKGWTNITLKKERNLQHINKNLNKKTKELNY